MKTPIQNVSSQKEPSTDSLHLRHTCEWSKDGHFSNGPQRSVQSIRKSFSSIAIVALALVTFFHPLEGFSREVRVRGYFKSSGAYVAPHYRSAPNRTVWDNFSFKGNINPHTGVSGTRYYRSSPSPNYNSGARRITKLRIHHVEHK
jgi:hypothetical protein